MNTAQITRSTALILRPKSVESFCRGPIATSFFSHKGMIIAPRQSVQSQTEAEWLMGQIESRPLIQQRKILTGRGELLKLREIGRDGTYQLFVSATQPRDSIIVSKETKAKVRQIEIDEKDVSSFVEENLRRPQDKDQTYILVYHNHFDPKTGESRLKADALVMLYQKRTSLFSDKTNYILVHQLKSSSMKKVFLESILEDHPTQAIVSLDQVQHSRELYGEIYMKAGQISSTKIPISKQIWPFPIPSLPFTNLKKPTLTLKQKYRLYKEAVKKDGIFGLHAIGRVLHSAGKGLMEGALLYPILTLAQDTLKVAALMGFAVKLSVLFYLYGNNKSAIETGDVEAKERLEEILNKRIPLWERTPRFKTNSTLIRREKVITYLYLAASSIYFQLFPPIFKGLWGFGSSLSSAAVFVGAYLFSECLNLFVDAFSHRNSFKITENQLRNNPHLPEYKKNFWAIHAFQDNLETLLYTASLGAGFGIYSLAAIYGTTLAAAAGISLGAVSLVLCASKFLLPLFGREEETCLEIKEPNYLLERGMLKFSENIFVDIRKNQKVPMSEKAKKHRVLFPDFAKSNVKLIVRNLKSITVKKSWLEKFFPFSFAKKQIITIKTKDKSDPAITFYAYGDKTYKEKEVRERFIEELQKENIL